MRAVQTHFTEGPFEYTQVTREGMWAIYRQTHRASGVPRYEVVRLRVQPAAVLPSGYESLEHEAYPTARRWGIDGWTYHTEEAARVALADHLQRQAVAP